MKRRIRKLLKITKAVLKVQRKIEKLIKQVDKLEVEEVATRKA